MQTDATATWRKRSEPEPDCCLTPGIGPLALPLVGSDTEGQVPPPAGLIAHIAPKADAGAGQRLSVDREARYFGPDEGRVEYTVAAKHPS